MKQMNAGLIGCGDYLRWEVDQLTDSKIFNVKYTFDLDQVKSLRIADKIGATAVESVDKIFDDPEIETVMIYTPPWARQELIEKAVEKGKQIIATKPLASNYEKAKEFAEIVNNQVSFAVFYGRSGDAAVETIKEILNSGEIGDLVLYKEDWLHHYPIWNDWATDPEKNGGPFMDAMVHNLNKSRYLIGSKVKSINYFSDNYAQSLKCNDTESLKLNFENGASSQLFITWAADLEVFDPTGNDRVHYGILQMITDQGWYITQEEIDGQQVIKAVKEKEVKAWPVKELEYTRYDDFAIRVRKELAPALDINDALIDMQIMDFAVKNVTVPCEIV